MIILQTARKTNFYNRFWIIITLSESLEWCYSEIKAIKQNSILTKQQSTCKPIKICKIQQEKIYRIKDKIIHRGNSKPLCIRCCT